MPRFEVHVPAAPPAVPADVTLRVDAEHWVAALRTGLAALGVTQTPSNVLCDVQPDGAILVTDARGGGVFRVKEVAAGPALAPPPAGPRAPAAPQAPAAASAGGPRDAPEGPPPSVRARAAVAEIAPRLAALDRRADPAESLGVLLDLAIERTRCEAGSVLLARPGGELEFAVVRGPRAEEIVRLGLIVPAGRGIVGFCVREDVAVAIPDAARDPRFHRAVSQAIGYETRSIVCAPIPGAGRALGALEVLNKDERGGRVDAVDLAVTSYLARRAAELLEPSPDGR